MLGFSRSFYPLVGEFLITSPLNEGYLPSVSLFKLVTFVGGKDFGETYAWFRLFLDPIYFSTVVSSNICGSFAIVSGDGVSLPLYFASIGFF